MKKIIKIFGIAVLSAVVFLGITACSNGSTDSGNVTNSPYLGATLNLSVDSVWQRNYNTSKLSNAYLPYTDSFTMQAFIYQKKDPPPASTDEDQSLYRTIPASIATKIKEDHNLIVPSPLPALLDWVDFKQHFNEWNQDETDHLFIDDDSVKFNILAIAILDSNNKVWSLIKEGMTGSTTSLSEESTMFIYADKDCTITATRETLSNITTNYEPFVLNLKAGWNTVCRKQTNTTFWVSTYEMSVKNPNYRWVKFP